MENLEFDKWWNDFFSHPIYTKIDQTEVAEYLRREIRIIPEEKRDSFLNGLVNLCINKNHGWQIALMALESEAKFEQFETINKFTEELFQKENNDLYYISILVRFLLFRNSHKDIEIVKTFLTKYIQANEWSIVFWKVWQTNKELFLKNWLEKIELVGYEIITKDFENILSRLDALVSLKEYLVTNNKTDTWNQISFILSKNLNDSIHVSEKKKHQLQNILNV